jgi:hypothetical protein
VEALSAIVITEFMDEVSIEALRERYINAARKQLNNIGLYILYVLY